MIYGISETDSTDQYAMRAEDKAQLSEEEIRQAKALAKARLQYGSERKRAPKWMQARQHG